MTLAEANALGHAEFVAAFGLIFEHSPWVAERAWRRRPFISVEALHSAMTREVERAPRQEQLALLRAHPELGARASVSAASESEQRDAGFNLLTAGESKFLEMLNLRYRDKFGFPFIYAVKGSKPADIQVQVMLRLGSTPDDELQEALRQVGRIAWFRLEDMLE